MTKAGILVSARNAMVWLHFGGPVQTIPKQLEKNQKKT
jgi:hypothetical protein